MNPMEKLRARIAELREAVKTSLEARGTIVDKALDEKREMSTDEKAAFDKAGQERSAAERDLKLAEERLTELEQMTALGSKADEARKGGARTEDAPVYARGNNEVSYFRDLYQAKINGDPDAFDRLRRNSAQTAAEQKKRAMSSVPGAQGGNGELAPPLWIVEDVAKLARAGRVFADSLEPKELPNGVSSINIPRVTQGTKTGKQGTQNSALTQQDLKTDSVSSGISTYGGKAVSSQQDLDQTAINLDEIILGDIAADYAVTFDTAVLSGTGTNGDLRGVLTVANSGPNNITFTSGSPTVAQFYSKVGGAIAGVQGTRILPATAIYMHPRRWYWLLTQSDANGRPLVIPNGVDTTSFNGVAAGTMMVPQGPSGVLIAYPVFLDPNIPTTLGAGNNQDTVLVGRKEDARLWESNLRMEVFRETYADSVAVLFRGYAYSALIPDRYATSYARVDGTGLVAPTF